MKKAVPIIILAVAVIVAVFVGARVLSQKKSQGSGEEQKTVVPQGEKKEESFTGRLEDTLSLGKSMKCTWKKDGSNFGTAYIKDKNIYTEVTASGKKMYSIVVDNCTYWWEDGQTQGYKICVEPDKEAEEAPASEAFSWETPDISYDCTDTIVSDSKFTPPGTVQFTDLFESMQGFNLPTGQ